jgi:hypothetical protein
MDVFQDRAKLRAVLCDVMSLRFPQMVGNLLIKILLASLEGVSFKKLASTFVYLLTSWSSSICGNHCWSARIRDALFSVYYASRCWCVTWLGSGRWQTFVDSRGHRTQPDAVILFRNKVWGKTVLKIVPNSPLPTPKCVKALWFQLWFTQVTMRSWMLCWI